MKKILLTLVSVFCLNAYGQGLVEQIKKWLSFMLLIQWPLLTEKL